MRKRIFIVLGLLVLVLIALGLLGWDISTIFLPISILTSLALVIYETAVNYQQKINLEHYTSRPLLKFSYRALGLGSNVKFLYRWNKDIADGLNNYKARIKTGYYYVWGFNLKLVNNKPIYDIVIDFIDIKQKYYIDYLKTDTEYILILQAQFADNFKHEELLKTMKTSGIDVYYKTELKEECLIHYSVKEYGDKEFYYLEKENEKYAQNQRESLTYKYIEHYSCQEFTFADLRNNIIN